jgi:hypothetical protein
MANAHCEVGTTVHVSQYLSLLAAVTRGSVLTVTVNVVIIVTTVARMPVPVTALSKEYVCGSSPA